MALQAILAGLPADFPVPLLIVQHISPGFLQGFAEWLGAASPLPVQVAKDGESPLPGHVYLAPDGTHMVMAGERIRLESGTPENGHRPAISRLFRSVAETHGRNAAGVLLSGMGADGAAELKLLHDLGATTVAQSKGSSVVHGMPGVAIELGGAGHVLEPHEIAGLLARWAGDAS